MGTVEITRLLHRRARFRATARRVNQLTTIRVVARIGLAMKGLVFLVIAGIAVSIVVGAGGRASQSGALSAIATTRIGSVLLWVATGGLWGLALWQWTEAVWVRGTKGIRRFFRLLVPLCKSIGFSATSLITLAFALGYQLGDREGMAVLTEALLTTTGGKVVLLIVGGAVVGVGAAAVFRGLSRHFREEIDTERSRPRVRHAVDVLGVTGYVAKGLAYGVVGALLVTAIVTDRAAGGLDGALKYLATLPSGSVLLGVVAIGLAAHGLYLMARCVFFPTRDRQLAVATRPRTGSAVP